MVMTIGVYGTGRFGAFWATAIARQLSDATAQGPGDSSSVLCYNRSQRPVPVGTEMVDLEQLCRCDALFLCVAISAIEPVLREIEPLLHPGALVLDTCSVKVYPSSLMESILPQSCSVIATHPMFGPDSANQGMEGLPMVFCPVRCSDSQSAEWMSFFSAMGLRVVRMTPEAHDREAAHTQGITHFVGRVLADLQLAPSEIATVGYDQLLRVIEQTCNDPFQLFVDLQRYNPYTDDMRRELQGSLHRLLELLETRLDSR